MPTNDNDPRAAGKSSPLPDAHGRAALLLVESLIHGLCENTTLDARSAVDIAERAVDVQLGQAQEASRDARSMWRSHDLLASILASLKLDDIDGPSLRPVP